MGTRRLSEGTDLPKAELGFELQEWETPQSMGVPRTGSDDPRGSGSPQVLPTPSPGKAAKRGSFHCLKTKSFSRWLFRGQGLRGMGEGRRAPDSLPSSGPQPLPPRGRRKDTAACGAA